MNLLLRRLLKLTEIKTYADKIASQTSSNLTQSNENAVANVIAFFIEPQLKLAEEGYTLQVKTDSIILKAATEAGLFHAKESLLQLSRFGNGKVKCCTINDAPRYQWRGFMLDESRHFFGKEKSEAISGHHGFAPSECIPLASDR